MDPPPCAGGCGFYGSPATENLCSKCYKDCLKGKESESTDLAVKKLVSSTSNNQNDSQDSEALLQKPRKRCNCCNKRVGILGFSCSGCKGTFCGVHRYPENHACNFDFKAAGRVSLAKANPVIKADKLETRV